MQASKEIPATCGSAVNSYTSGCKRTTTGDRPSLEPETTDALERLEG